MQKVSLMNIIDSYMEYKKTNKTTPLEIDGSLRLFLLKQQDTAESLEKYVFKYFDSKINSEHVFICLAMIQEFENGKIDQFHAKVLGRMFI